LQTGPPGPEGRNERDFPTRIVAAATDPCGRWVVSERESRGLRASVASEAGDLPEDSPVGIDEGDRQLDLAVAGDAFPAVDSNCQHGLHPQQAAEGPGAL